MPNIIELNLLENRSIVAKMQGIPLANENSYKIIAGEENATIFSIKSMPVQYENARLTVEMVNAKGCGVEETDIGQIEVDFDTYIGFSLPVGMAVAGYGYILIRAYLGNETVPFQPLKIKVWNTIPQWQDFVDKTTFVDLTSEQIINGYKRFTDPVTVRNGKELNADEALYGAKKITLVDNEIGSGDIYELYFPYPMFREATLATVEEIEHGQIIPAVSSKALRDGHGNDIVDTYATKTEVEKNTQGIKMLKNIFLQTEVIASAEIGGAFTTRVTADGQKIVDEQETQVLEIKGSTVRCENLFDKSKILSNNVDFNQCTDYSVSNDKNVLIATGNAATEAADFLYATGWVSPTSYDTQHNSGGIPMKVGDTVTVSADFTLITQGARTPQVKCYLTNHLNSGNITTGAAKTISATKTRLSWTFNVEKVEGRYYPVFAINSNRVKIENVMISKNGVTEYQPYFTDLKHSYFKGVKSTGRNLIDVSKMVNQHFTIDENGVCTMTKTSKDGRFSGAFVFPEPLPAGKYTVSCDFVNYTGSYRNWLQFTHTGGEKGFFTGQTKRTITFTQPVKSIGFYADSSDEIGAYYQFKNFMLNTGDTAQPFEPYVEDTYELPQTLELMKYDSFNPQTGEIARRTGYFTSETILTEEELANYNNPIVSADGKSIVYELATPIIETIVNAPKSYTAYNQGTETVVQGETDNSVYGALPSVKNDYLVIVGGEEDEI